MHLEALLAAGKPVSAIVVTYYYASELWSELLHALQPSKVMSKSGRWVASPTAQGATQAHSFFGRPSKAAANSPLGHQGVSNQPHMQSNGQGPITASWNNSTSTPNGTTQLGSNAGSIPSTSSAQLAAAPTSGRWQGFTQMFRPRPRPHRHGSGALLVNADPAILSSIAESDPDTGLPASHSTDLDASTAASSANKLWAISSPSLSPRRSPSASKGSGGQPGPSQGSYIAPSPWTTPAKPPQSSSASPGLYPVPSPQNTPLGTPPQSRGQSPPATVGPFEAAARARAAQARAPGSSPGDSAGSGRTANRTPAQPVYPVPSPATSSGQQQRQVRSNAASPARSATRSSSQSHRTPSQAGQSSPSRDWSTTIPGMSTTKAAGSRRRRL